MKPLLTMKALRIAAGVSQLDLARAIGVAQPNISLWENGLEPVPDARAGLIAAELGCLPEDLREPYEDWLGRRGGRRAAARASRGARRAAVAAAEAARG